MSKNLSLAKSSGYQVRRSLINKAYLGRDADSCLPADPQFGFEHPPTMTDQSARPISALIEDAVANNHPTGLYNTIDVPLDSRLHESIYGDELPEVTQRIYKFDDQRAEVERKTTAETREVERIKQILHPNDARDDKQEKNPV